MPPRQTPFSSDSRIQTYDDSMDRSQIKQRFSLLGSEAKLTLEQGNHDGGIRRASVDCGTKLAPTRFVDTIKSGTKSLIMGTGNEKSLNETEIFKGNYNKESNESIKISTDLKQRDQKIKSLQQQLDTARKENEEARESLNQMQKVMDNKELFLDALATDEDIVARFLALNNSIKAWSMKFVDNDVRGSGFHPAMIPSYSKVAPLCRGIRDLDELVSNRKSRRLFTRGWVSYTICELVFHTVTGEPGVGKSIEKLDGNDLWLCSPERHSLANLERKIHYTSMSTGAQIAQ
ncbi:hypothetical protein BDV26DRAFT_275026 [Aspergillus bertholletiae]|uniref:Uncharacterized protein n=1 Tax=Aspergillus bertholletiae TaxID=1226010 RepID=A0A5N7AQ62_9EURO|nr:hypothetical protein BDV26DRAFT_275026 [Aspergillus bertholletiae]